MAELADVTVGDGSTRTIAFESEDPQLVIDTVAVGRARRARTNSATRAG